MAIKVLNRSNDTVTYELPEMNIRRVFAEGESKNIEPEELEALFSSDGGMALIKDYLLINDKNWVKEHWDAPIEYFWTQEEVKKCLLEDSLDLFSETLDFAPEGVVELIQLLSWRLPLTDLNKIDIIQKKTGFDVLGAIQIMKDNTSKQTIESSLQGRLRQERE